MSDNTGIASALGVLRPFGIGRVLTIDTEYRLDEKYRQHVVCLVAHEWPGGRTDRIWLDDNHNQAVQLPCGEDTRWVSFVATAELRSMLVLGHPLPKRVLDLYVENRWLHNLQESTNERKRKKEEHFWSLPTALRRFGCDSMGVEEKEAMRDLILRGGPYTEQKKDILDYCEADVTEIRTINLSDRFYLIFDVFVVRSPVVPA